MSENNPTLDKAIADLSFGQLYDLARGLMLSTCDRQQVIDLLFGAMDTRRKTEATFEKSHSLEYPDGLLTPAQSRIAMDESIEADLAQVFPRYDDNLPDWLKV